MIIMMRMVLMMMMMFMIMKMIETSAPVQWESCKHRDDHDDDHRDEGEGGDYVHDHRNVCIV